MKYENFGLENIQNMYFFVRGNARSSRRRFNAIYGDDGLKCRFRHMTTPKSPWQLRAPPNTFALFGKRPRVVFAKFFQRHSHRVNAWQLTHIWRAMHRAGHSVFLHTTCAQAAAATTYFSDTERAWMGETERASEYWFSAKYVRRDFVGAFAHP